MKKLFITALFAVAIIAQSFAAPKKVSSAILAHFNTDFKKAANISWIITNEYTKVQFTEDNTEKEVFYNDNGDVLATSKSITLDELPALAKKIVAKKFEGYQIKEAVMVEGFGDAGYYISGENDKESVVLKVNDHSEVSVYLRTKK